MEVLIAVTAVATLGATIAALIVVAQRGQENARRRDIGSNIAAAISAAGRSMLNADDFASSQGYNRIYCPPDEDDPDEELCNTADGPDYRNRKGSANRYRPALIGDGWALAEGDIVTTAEGISFTNYVTITNVCRKYNTGTNTWEEITGVWENNPAEQPIGECPFGSRDDPASQRVATVVSAPQMTDVVVTEYLTRSRAGSAVQSDWSGSGVADAGGGDTTVTFSIQWNDLDNDERVMAHVCKSDAMVPETQQCADGSWTESSAFVQAPGTPGPWTMTLTYTPVPADATGVPHNYWVFVCDDDNVCPSSGEAGSFTVN